VNVELPFNSRKSRSLPENYQQSKTSIEKEVFLSYLASSLKGFYNSPLGDGAYGQIHRIGTQIQTATF
jgi:hypothetical protein